jgi:nucleoside-diphosphate-sugar epimerase
MKILIIGKNSFIGNSIINYSDFDEFSSISVRDSLPKIDFLMGFDVIIHVAGIVHQKDAISKDVYNEINTVLSFNIARLAKEAGIKQFIFISTVSVYGKPQKPNYTFKEYSSCRPINHYGKSKLEAEKQLLEMNDQEFKIAILRMPLVYGEHVRANMQSIIKLVDKIPLLPFGKLKNKRSFLGTQNLGKYIDALILKKSQGIYVACDSKPVSTEELVKLIAKYLNKKRILVPIPKFAIKIGRKILGPIVDKLYGSFILDNSNTIQELGISNLASTEEQIAQMIQSYIQNKD